MSTKIIKAGVSEADPFETSISQALVELETNSDLKAQLRELYITKAKEIELHNKKVRKNHKCAKAAWTIIRIVVLVVYEIEVMSKVEAYLLHSTVIAISSSYQ